MNIYVVLFKTNTKIGIFLRFFLKFKYNHASICLDEEYKDIYSFSRKFKNLPFAGGFVREDLFCMFNGKEALDVRIFKIPVCEREIKKIIDTLCLMELDVEGYIYNLASMVFIPLNLDIETYKAYNCSQFVAKILSDCNVVKLRKPYYKYTPEKLDTLLQEYKMMDLTLYKKDFIIQNSHFDEKFSMTYSVKTTAVFFVEVLKRIAIFRKKAA